MRRGRLDPDDPWSVGQRVFRARVERNGWAYAGNRVVFTEYVVVGVTRCGAWLKPWEEPKVDPSDDPLIQLSEGASFLRDDTSFWRKTSSKYARREKKHAIWDLHVRAKAYVKHAERRLAEAKRQSMQSRLALDELVDELSRASSDRTTVFYHLRDDFELLQLYFAGTTVPVQYDPGNGPVFPSMLMKGPF